MEQVQVLEKENEQLKAERDALESSYTNAEMNLEHMTDLYEQLQAQHGALKDALKQAKEAIDIMCFTYFAYPENGYRRCRQCQLIDSHRPGCETGEALAKIAEVANE
jgi:FtsZ-binding cell division protein ZapB